MNPRPRHLLLWLWAIATMPLAHAKAQTTLSDPSIRFTVPTNPYIVLKRGPVEAIVVDNRAVDDSVLKGHRARYSGIASLKHEKRAENLFVPAVAGLNFEHIHDGTTQASDILYEPRNVPMELRVIDKETVELYQKPTPYWGLESCQRFHILEDGTIELSIECVPRKAAFRNGYVGLFWASYIHQPESLDIQFLGHPDGADRAPRWVRATTARHGVDATHLASADERAFTHDQDFPMKLIFTLSKWRFTEPWYFGSSHGMAYAQLFRTDDGVRFSQSPSGGGNGNPAWDFQFLIPDYKVDQLYRFVMRARYTPLENPDDLRRSVAPHLRALDAEKPKRRPAFRTVDLDRDEVQEVELDDGKKVTVKLLGVEETRDSLRSAIRQARAKIEINGTPGTLTSGNYRLPVTIGGVQVDCPVTRGYYQNHDPFEDSWGLVKDVRLRFWPAGSPWFARGEFVYPVRQRWFASSTQIGNEPSYVDGGDQHTAKRSIYYHSGNDIGGCEGMIDVVSACDGLVVSAGGRTLAEYTDLPFYKSRGDYDYVYVLDEHGWFYRYAHLKSIDPAVRPGAQVNAGQKLGVLGKEGSSGGWAHLHFDIKARQPSGKWGIQDAYPFLWEAYVREHKPEIIAVARPHHLTAVGEKVTLDGSRSWSASGPITRHHWTFGDGGTAEGATVERRYDKPGSYSEILMVSDAKGQVAYDFAIVQVLDRDPAAKLPPTIHASYSPAFDIRAGDPVTFKVRTFRTDSGNETWNFGDGSETVTVHSGGSGKEHDPAGYAQTIHRFTKAGHYVVRVEGTGNEGMTAMGHLAVHVIEK